MKQGDQIGRIFPHWVIKFEHFCENYKNSQNAWAIFAM
jgi:hypothetical protein